METEKPQPRPRRRSPWLAGIANLFFPPLGHVYAGRTARGVLLFAGVTGIELTSFWIAARSVRMTPVFLAFALSIAGVLWRIADAAMISRWQSGSPSRWYQRWYVYVATMALSYGFGNIAILGTTRYLAQAYYLPSASMLPTIGIGDRFLVDKLTYRGKAPERYDVIVFRAPPQVSPEENLFTKRLIGLPGDTVEVVPDTLLVDGRPAVVVNDDPGSANDNLMHSMQHGLR